MRFGRILLFVTCYLVIYGCSTKDLRESQVALAPNVPDPSAPTPESYVVGPGDALKVVVWKEPSLSGPVTVRPDGFVTLPLVNEVQVAGLSTGDLRETLQQRFREYVTDAYVTVTVEKISSSEVFLIGEVTKPGAYPLMGNDTLLQLLTRAGGLSPFADRDSIDIVRREGDQLKKFVVDYDAILEGDLKQDILLRPGDRIIVH
ncbi:MAG: polysaccharide biosynthesis/export family protein [Candidatus Binatia bacterium]